MLKKIFTLLVAIATIPVIAQNPWNMCEPTSVYGTGDGDYFGEVSYNGNVLFAGSSADDYYYYLSELLNWTKGGQYTMAITNTTEVSSEYVVAYLDVNGDNFLDEATENVAEFAFTSPGQLMNLNITVPMDAVSETVMLRLKMHFWSDEGAPCGDSDYGQVLDFAVSMNDDSQFYCYPTFDSGTLDGDNIGSINGVSMSYYYSEFGATYLFLNTEFENMIAGQSTVFSMFGGSYGDDNYYLYVDETYDGFTIDDLKDSHTVTTADESFELSYTPNITPGVYRARIMCRFLDDAEPCANSGYGQCIDFWVIVTQNDATPYCSISLEDGTADGDYMATFEVTNTGLYSYQYQPGPFYNDFTQLDNLSMYYALPGRVESGALTSGTYDGPEFYTAWIDYDNSNTFEESEQVFEVSTSGPNETANFGFTNPNYTGEGITRMRVINNYFEAPVSACDMGDFFGEVEDHMVIKVADNDAYCNPYFYYGNTDGDFINAVQFQQVNLTGIGQFVTSFYKNYTSSVAQVLAGGTYTLTVQSGDYSSDFYKAWIDWNNDGVYDNTTEVAAVGTETSTAYQNLTWNVSVPAGQALGNYRMRIMCSYNEDPEACTENGYGEYIEITVAVVTEINVSEWASKAISLYPNPSNGQLTVTTESSETIQATVFDVAGKMIDQFNVQGMKTWSHDYAPGMYTLALTHDGARVVKTFIVE